MEIQCRNTGNSVRARRLVVLRYRYHTESLTRHSAKRLSDTYLIPQPTLTVRQRFQGTSLLAAMPPLSPSLHPPLLLPLLHLDRQPFETIESAES